MILEGIWLDGISQININNMKKLLEKIATFIRKVFTDISDELEENAPLAVRVTNILKEGITKHDGSIQWMLNKTEYTKDNEAYQFIKDKLPDLAIELAIIDGLADSNTNKFEAWKAYVNYINSKVNKSQTKEWIFIAGEVLGFIINKKAPIQALIMASQRAFQLLFGKK